MRKFAIALVAAITVGATLPAAAQVGFYAGPGGIGVGVGPGYYGHFARQATADRAMRARANRCQSRGDAMIIGSELFQETEFDDEAESEVVVEKLYV